jgi:hypothetical protein
MKKLNIIVMIFSIFAFSLAYAAEHKNFQFEKKPELRHIHPGKPVKIKLKRSTTGKYSWDLTGDDLNEIIDIDSKLRKLLDVQ